MAASPDPRSVVLSPGRHSSPHEGACVVELASILAREAFNDRPRCVCPVIGAFLRAWNDRAGHADRQRLRPYAKRIVGSRGDARLTRERRDICLEWAGGEASGAVRRRLRRLRLRIRIGVYCGFAAAVRLNEGAGAYAARLAFSQGDHESAFELLDALLATGAERPPEPPAPVIVPAQVNGNGRVNGDGRVNGNGRANGNGLPAANGAGAADRLAEWSPSQREPAGSGHSSR